MAYRFDSFGDYLTRAHMSAFDEVTKLTISYWVKNPDRDDGTHVAQANAALTRGFRMAISSTYRPDFWVRSSGYEATVSSPNDDLFTVTPTVWSHKLVTWDAAVGAGHAKFYLDGVFLAQYSGAILHDSPTIGTHTDPLQIGGVSNSAWTDVLIAEVAIWAGDAVDGYASALWGGASPMAQAITPTFYLRMRSDLTITAGGGTMAAVGAPVLVSADNPTVSDPPSGGATPTRNRVCIVL